jgi:hypothetical protein
MISAIDQPIRYSHQQAHKEKMTRCLKLHLEKLHFVLSEGKVLKEGTITRYSSETHLAFFNAVFGLPEKETQITDQVRFFHGQQSSFVWFVEEKQESPSFEEQLNLHGFKCLGIFQGMVRDLSAPIADPIFPQHVHVEKITSVERLHQLNDTLCEHLKVTGIAKQLRNQVYEKEFNAPQTPISHYVVISDEKIISSVAAVCFNDVVIFMNGVTDPNYRQKGVFTNLRRYALQSFAKNGCKYALSFLNEQAMAKNICTNDGSITYWRYKPYIKTYDPNPVSQP